MACLILVRLYRTVQLIKIAIAALLLGVFVTTSISRKNWGGSAP